MLVYIYACDVYVYHLFKLDCFKEKKNKLEKEIIIQQSHTNNYLCFLGKVEICSLKF